MNDKILLSSRKISLAAGVLYLLTFVSIPTLAIYSAVKSANYVLGAGPDTFAIIGGISEIIAPTATIGSHSLLIIATGALPFFFKR